MHGAKGDLVGPDAMIFRPTFYAPVSRVYPPSETVAGSAITADMLLVDRANVTVSDAHTTNASVLELQVSATGVFPGTDVPATLTGSVVHDSSLPPHASLAASITIPYAGDWLLHVTQGTASVQNFLDSPLQLHVSPAATDPQSCEVECSKVFIAGDVISATVEPFDEFHNPTSHSNDSFVGVVGSSNITKGVVMGGNTFAETMTDAGT